MDPLVATIVMRFVERLLVVGGGCLAIWCGYRLFLAMPSRERGAGKLELPGGVSIHLSRVGPGVFFSLFGAVILGLSYHYGVALDLPAGVTPQQQVAAGSTATAAPARATFTGIGQVSGVEPDASVLVAVAVDVERLNRAARQLDPTLDANAQSDIRRSLRAAKLALMRTSWSDTQWGDRATFTAWIAAGEPMPPPDPIAGAVAVYRGGQ